MKINQLPEDMVGEIFSFISLETLSTCNKIFWRENYNKKLKNTAKINHSYYRFLLRNDLNFIFQEYLMFYFPIFIKNKKLIYQDKIFPRKIELLRYLTCFVFESPKCKIIIEKFMKRDRLVFKKIKTKLNKWTN